MIETRETATVSGPDGDSGVPDRVEVAPAERRLVVSTRQVLDWLEVDAGKLARVTVDGGGRVVFVVREAGRG